MLESLKAARESFLALAKTKTIQRDELLANMRLALIAHRTQIDSANSEDLNESRALAAEGKLPQTLVDRLGLYGSKFDGLMGMVESVEKLADPLNNVSYSHDMLEDGSLSVHRVSCPIGVIAVIFESSFCSNAL